MSWSIDTVHSHVGFSVKHVMVTTVRGQFKSYRATEVNLDPQDFTRSSFAGEIDVTSIDTGNADRDNHLRTNGVAKNPYGKTVTGFSAHGVVNRKDFGVSFNALLETGGVAVGEKVKLEVEIELAQD
jgi:polyisoprenoid-binding protein YceI